MPTSLAFWGNGHHRIFGRLHICLTSAVPENCPAAPYHYFEVGEEILKCNYRDPDGPANLLMLYQFCELVDLEILQNSHRSTALCSGEEPSDRVQAAFLLGAYMIIRHDVSADNAMERLSPALADISAAFHVPDGSGDSACLPLRDCLAAVQRTRGLGWIAFAKGQEAGEAEADFDPEEYAYFDNPLNADLTEVVPGRLLVSSCPRVLPDGAEWADRFDAAGRFVARDFSPAYAADHLAQFDTALCVRVGFPRYGRDVLDGTGLGLLDVYSEDAPSPSPATVDSFLAAADAASPRAVALQGDSRSGPAAALAGAFLVRRHGFAAREAAAWLRIVRPGCVAGGLLRFLSTQEQAAAAAALEAETGQKADACTRAPSAGALRRQSTGFLWSFGRSASAAALAAAAGADEDDAVKDAAAGYGARRRGSTGRLQGLLSWVGGWTG
jgi:hypothetical protein